MNSIINKSCCTHRIKGTLLGYHPSVIPIIAGQLIQVDIPFLRIQIAFYISPCNIVVPWQIRNVATDVDWGKYVADGVETLKIYLSVSILTVELSAKWARFRTSLWSCGKIKFHGWNIIVGRRGVSSSGTHVKGNEHSACPRDSVRTWCKWLEVTGDRRPSRGQGQWLHNRIIENPVSSSRRIQVTS